MEMMRGRAGQSGQATIEYIIILSVVVTAFMILSAGLSRMKLAKNLMKPITGEFASAYRYGHPKAKGYEDGGPEFHPRADAGGSNFRLFINPGRR